MSDLKQINNAENHLIVGSLEVLGDIEGSSMKTIKHTVNKLTESVQATNAAMENYWGGIGSDNIVTPAEKEILYSKWQTLEQTFSAIRKIATDRKITDTADYISLRELYDTLHDYIFNELKLFDEMDSKTVLPDSEHFNSSFENYYKQQINFQSILSSTTIRTVSSLNVSGTENEVVIYKNRFFKYSNGKWISFDSPEYEGVLEELPEDIINHYFVAGKQGGFRDTFKIKVNKKYLVNEDEKYVTVPSKLFEYGYIYVYTQYKGWQKVTDKNNWRYIVALNDLLANNIPISSELEDYINAKDQAILEQANSNTQDAISAIHTPVNLGKLTTFPPSNYGKGDWFLWGANDASKTYTYGGTTRTITLKKAFVYKFYNDIWNELSPTDEKNGDKYMGYLSDILNLMDATENGYFSTIFANALFACKAFIDKITIKTLQSANYDSTHGFKLDQENGTFECNNGIFRGSVETDVMTIQKGSTQSAITLSITSSMKVSEFVALLNDNAILPNSTYPATINNTSNLTFDYTVATSKTGHINVQSGSPSFFDIEYYTTYTFYLGSTTITKTYTRHQHYIDSEKYPIDTNSYTTDPTMGATYTIVISAVGKITMNNLPSAYISSQPNNVWRDFNHCLRVGRFAKEFITIPKAVIFGTSNLKSPIPQVYPEIGRSGYRNVSTTGANDRGYANFNDLEIGDIFLLGVKGMTDSEHPTAPYYAQLCVKFRNWE